MWWFGGGGGVCVGGEGWLWVLSLLSLSFIVNAMNMFFMLWWLFPFIRLLIFFSGINSKFG